MKNEGAVKAAVKRRLTEAGAWFTMPHQTGFSQYGVPDFLACVNGYFLAIETKFGLNRPTVYQVHEMGCISNANGYVLVINETNLHELDQLLERLT